MQFQFFPIDYMAKHSANLGHNSGNNTQTWIKNSTINSRPMIKAWLIYTSSPSGFILGHNKPKAPAANNKKGIPEKKTRKLKPNCSLIAP